MCRIPRDRSYIVLGDVHSMRSAGFVALTGDAWVIKPAEQDNVMLP